MWESWLYSVFAPSFTNWCFWSSVSLTRSNPDPTNENHYKSFSDSYGTDTTKAFMPSRNITASKGHEIPFSPLVQHAKNTNLKIMCTECNKPQIIYAKKKVSPWTIRKFKIKTLDLWFTCGASIEELVGNEPPFNSMFIRNNLICQTPVEAIYHSANYATCCSHCGSTCWLQTSKEVYPICNTCRVTKHLKPTLKRKASKKKTNLMFLFICCLWFVFFCIFGKILQIRLYIVLNSNIKILIR